MTIDEENAICAVAIEFLERRGYTVTLGTVYRDFVTVKEFRESLPIRITAAGMWRRLKSDKCPPFESKASGLGRVSHVLPTPALIAFCSQPVNGGRMLKGVEL